MYEAPDTPLIFALCAASVRWRNTGTDIFVQRSFLPLGACTACASVIFPFATVILTCTIPYPTSTALPVNEPVTLLSALAAVVAGAAGVVAAAEGLELVVTFAAGCVLGLAALVALGVGVELLLAAGAAVSVV